MVRLEQLKDRIRWMNIYEPLYNGVRVEVYMRIVRVKISKLIVRGPLN